MADRAELVEAVLEVYPEGVALLDQEERVVCWNRAAELITGYSGATVLGRALPQALEPLMGGSVFEPLNPLTSTGSGSVSGRGSLVHAQHQRGHDLPAMVRRIILRNTLGARIGMAAVFHLAERITALPHGDTSEGSEVRESQADLRERLEAAQEALCRNGTPLGLLWFSVDQAAELRKTHGARACEAMLEIVERTLANALRSGDEIGRWGDDEFLILSHEPASSILYNYAQVLAGVARTAVFRWWGDRVSLTASVGAVQADASEDLGALLRRAQSAMQTSMQAGGNHVTLATGRLPCSQS